MVSLILAFVFTLFLQGITASPSNAAESMPFLCTNCNKSLSSCKYPAKLAKIPCKSAMVSCKCTPPNCVKSLNYHLEVCDVTSQNGKTIEEFRKICLEVSCSYFQVGTKKNWKLIYFQKKPYPGIQKNSSSSFHVDPQLLHKLDCQLEPKKEDGILKTTRKKIPKDSTKGSARPDWARGLMGKTAGGNGAKGRSVLPKSAPQTVKAELRKDKQNSLVTKEIKISRTTKAKGFHEAIVKRITPVTTANTKPPKPFTVKQLSNSTRIATIQQRNDQFGKVQSKSRSLKPRYTNASSKKAASKALKASHRNSTRSMSSMATSWKFMQKFNASFHASTTKRQTLKDHIYNSTTIHSTKNGQQKTMNHSTTHRSRTTKQARSATTKVHKVTTAKSYHRNASRATKIGNWTTEHQSTRNVTKTTSRRKCKGDKNRKCDELELTSTKPPEFDRCISPPQLIQTRIVCTRCETIPSMTIDKYPTCVLTQFLCRRRDPPQSIAIPVCNMSHHSGAELRSWVSTCTGSRGCQFVQAKYMRSLIDYLILHDNKIYPGIMQTVFYEGNLTEVKNLEEFCRAMGPEYALVRNPPICKHPQQLQDTPHCVYKSFSASGTLTCSQCLNNQDSMAASPTTHVTCTIRQVLCLCVNAAACSRHPPFLHLSYCEANTETENLREYCNECRGRQVTLADGTMYLIHFQDNLLAGKYCYLGKSGRQNSDMTLIEYCSSVQYGFSKSQSPSLCCEVDYGNLAACAHGFISTGTLFPPTSNVVTTTTTATTSTKTTTTTSIKTTQTPAPPQGPRRFKLICTSPKDISMPRRTKTDVPDNIKEIYPDFHCDIEIFTCPSTCSEYECNNMPLPPLKICKNSLMHLGPFRDPLIACREEKNFMFFQAMSYYDGDLTGVHNELYQISITPSLTLVPALMQENSVIGDWKNEKSRQEYCNARQSGPVCLESANLFVFGKFCGGIFGRTVGLDRRTHPRGLGEINCKLLRLTCECPECQQRKRVCLTVCSISHLDQAIVKNWNKTVRDNDCQIMQVFRGNDRFFTLYEYKQLEVPAYNMISGGTSIYDRNGQSVSFELPTTTKDNFCKGLSATHEYRVAIPEFTNCSDSCEGPGSTTLQFPRWPWCANVKEQNVPPTIVEMPGRLGRRYITPVYAGKYDRAINISWVLADKNAGLPPTRFGCTFCNGVNTDADDFYTNTRYIEVFCTQKMITCKCVDRDAMKCIHYSGYFPYKDSQHIYVPVCALPSSFPLEWMKPGGNWSNMCTNHNSCKYPTVFDKERKTLLFYSCRTDLVYPGVMFGFDRLPTLESEFPARNVCTEILKAMRKVNILPTPPIRSYEFKDRE